VTGVDAGLDQQVCQLRLAGDNLLGHGLVMVMARWVWPTVKPRRSMTSVSSERRA